MPPLGGQGQDGGGQERQLCLPLDAPDAARCQGHRGMLDDGCGAADREPPGLVLENSRTHSDNLADQNC